MYNVFDLVNFIAASHAVDWYFGGSDRPSFLHSTELLLRYHLGSVVGGSLLQGFFYFVDLLLDFFFVRSLLGSPLKPEKTKPQQE